MVLNKNTGAEVHQTQLRDQETLCCSPVEQFLSSVEKEPLLLVLVGNPFKVDVSIKVLVSRQPKPNPQFMSELYLQITEKLTT